MNTNRSHAGAVLLVMIAAVSIAAAQATQNKLAGTKWQLVRIQSMDDKVTTPKDRSKYTMEFGVDGNLSMQIDCNRGRGTWKATEPNQLELGPLAVTRAMCPPGIAARPRRQGHGIRTVVCHEGRTPLPVAHG